MNSGIVRHIDPLGRIVIPKEIRNVLHIEDGDPLEIRLSGKTIMLERYSPIPDIKNQSEAFLKVAVKELDMAAAVCSLDEVVFYRGVSLSGNSTLSPEIHRLIRKQDFYQYHPEQPLYLTVSGDIMVNALYPIGTTVKPAGALALIRLKDKDATSNQLETAGIIAKILTELIKL